MMKVEKKEVANNVIISRKYTNLLGEVNGVINLLNKFSMNFEAAYRSIQDEVTYYTRAIDDVNHYIENYADQLKLRKSKKILDKIHEFRVKRREAKDTLRILKIFMEFYSHNKEIFSVACNVKGKIRREYDLINGERFYSPKELDYLFEGKDDEEDFRITEEEKKEVPQTDNPLLDNVVVMKPANKPTPKESCSLDKMIVNAIGRNSRRRKKPRHCR